MLVGAFIWALGHALAGEPAPAAPALTKLPELIAFVEADYPPEAFAAGREGTVVLAIDVDAQGEVQRVELLESAGAEFDEPAIAAACGFRFTPAEAEGLGPVPVRITYRYRFVRKIVGTPTVSATLPADEPPPPGAVVLSGTVREAGSRAPVGFVDVRVELAAGSTAGLDLRAVETATTTDLRGRFGLRGLPPGRHKLVLTAPLFDRLELEEELAPGEALEVLYYLTRNQRDPYEIVVRAKAPRKEIARRTLQLEEIQRIPGAQGDAIRVIQNLPGVARTPYGLGLLVVRGAPPQSTGVFLDGHRLPLLFHFGGVGGVTSVVQSRVLDEINFYPGGFGPQYGRLSAGAVELVTRDARDDRIHGEAVLEMLTIVPVTASIFVEGPVSSDPDDGAFTFALRRSQIDGVLALLLELTGSSVSLAPRFYDYQIRYDRPIGGDKRRMLTLFAYGSDDELILTGAGSVGANSSGINGTQSRTFFHRLNPRFTYRPDSETRFSISPIFGVDYTNTQTSEGGSNGQGFKLVARNLSLGLRVDGEVRLDERVKLSAGGDLLQFYFYNDSQIPAFTPVRNFPSPVAGDAPTRRDTASIPALAASAYVELELEPLRGLKLWPGVRLDLYDFQADAGPFVDPRLVEGRSLIGLDPRLTARYELLESLSLKGQVGIFREPPLPPQFYVSPALPLIRAEQVSLGVEWDIVDRLTLDLQGFYRGAHGVPVGTGDIEVVDGELRPVGFRPEGKQRSFGLELLLKLDKRWGLFGWVAYTLSRSEVRFGEDDDWDPNFFFDQTHNLNVVAVYELGLNWAIGIRFRYVTGGGLGSTQDRWYDADSDAYGRTLGPLVRAPAFHQLDVYVEKKWIQDEWTVEAYLDVQNVYNHTNTELYTPTFDFKGQVAIPGLPIFPAIGVKATF